jgi:hypothetical protein
MIKLAMRKVRPGQEDHLRKWMAELNRRKRRGPRDADGPVLIYAMEAADHARASSAFQNSTLSIDREHKRIMAQVLAESAHAELLYECKVEPSAC